MKQISERIPWLDTGRGISIVLVVFYHVIMIAQMRDISVSEIYVNINHLVKGVRMPFFFLMSGLLLSGKLGTPWKAYAGRYLWPTIWLFLIWNTFYTLVMGRPALQVLSSTLWPADIETPLWFLWALALFRFISRAAEPISLPVLLVAAGVSLLTYADILGQHRTFVEVNLLRYCVFFLAAAWYGPPVAAWITRNTSLSAVIAVLIFVVSWQFRFRFGFAVSGLLFAVAAAVTISDHLPRVSRVCAWLGKKSLEIFILHFLFILLILPLTAYLPGNFWWSVPVVTILALGLSVTLRKLVEPYAPWLFSLPRLRRMGRPGAPMA